MTLISAMFSTGSLFLGSDTEEAGEVHKENVAKWYGLQVSNEWRVRVGGAGNSATIDRYIQLHRKRLGNRSFDHEQFVRDSEDLMRETYERYVWPVESRQDNRFHVLIAMQHGIEQFLVSIRHDLVATAARYLCLRGSG